MNDPPYLEAQLIANKPLALINQILGTDMRIPVVSYDWKQELLNSFKNSDKAYLDNSFDWADVPPEEKFEIEGTEFQQDLFDSLSVSGSSNSMGNVI